MRKILVAVATVVGLGAIGAAAVAAGAQFRATATSAEEVPPPGVVIVSEGEARLNLKVDGETATYNLRITEPLENVLMAHLHKAPAGSNGGIAVWLYPSAPPASLIPGTSEGRLAKGVIEPADLCPTAAAPYCVNGVGNWDAFVADLQAGLIYVNVHTSQYPGGEVRGQVHAQHDDN